MSKFAHLYEGLPFDPQPVFRDLEPQAHEWPDGAVFAVTVRKEDLIYPNHWPFPGQDSATEFVAEDGWPVGFPEDKKGDFFKCYHDKYSTGGNWYRGLFHRGTPEAWRAWTDKDWETYQENFQCFPSTETQSQYEGRIGVQAGIVHALAPLLSGSPDLED